MRAVYIAIGRSTDLYSRCSRLASGINTDTCMCIMKDGMEVQEEQIMLTPCSNEVGQ